MTPSSHTWDRQPGRIRTVEISDPEFEHDGVRFVTVFSPALGGRGDISIFMPPGIETLTSVPVVLLLHGVYSSHWAWFYKGGAHRTAFDLVASGQMRPMLLVAPCDGLYRDGSGYLCHSGHDYEAWITQDVMDGVLKTCACSNRSSPIFIAGLSMGGYGALRLGTKHAHVFRGISAHSAITRLEEMLSFVSDPFPFEQIAAAEMDPLHWVDRNRGLLPPLRFDCGINDPLIEGNRRLHRELEMRQIQHQYFEFDGEHSWDYWRTHIASSLRFFEGILSGAVAGQP